MRTCLNVNINVIFQRIVQIHLNIQEPVTRQSESTAAIVASIVETSHQVIPHQQHLLESRL